MNKKFLFSIPLIAAFVTGCAGKKNYETIRYFTKSVLWTDIHKNFDILQLGDIHFSQADDLDSHYEVMSKTISEAKPDLIVLNGDTFTYADKGIVKEFFSFIDSKKIPWTFVYGNHDDQGYYSDNYIQRLLGGNTYEYVRFVNLEDDDVTGRSNFCINIKQGDEIKYQVYCLESHSYNFDTMHYDFIKEDQIEWYKRMVNYSKEKFGNPNSSMYFHIPLPEFDEAWKLFSENDPSVEKIIGENLEGTGSPTSESDTHLFDVVKELGVTKSISVAHDHKNDSVLKYKDIYLCYGVHATNRIYYDGTMIGGQVISVSHEDQSLSFKNILLDNPYGGKEAK